MREKFAASGPFVINKLSYTCDFLKYFNVKLRNFFYGNTFFRSDFLSQNFQLIRIHILFFSVENPIVQSIAELKDLV